jgi:hypothetical protein
VHVTKFKSNLDVSVLIKAITHIQGINSNIINEVLGAIVRASTVPVLSLESAMDHPHQGLADALTVRRRYPGRKVKVVLTWAPHVKPLPLAVPHTDPLFKDYHTLEDVPPHFLKEVAHFFNVYKDLESGQTVGKGWDGVEYARAAIKHSVEQYQAHMRDQK